MKDVDYKCQTIWVQFSSVQSLSSVQLFANPWIATHQASLSITISQSSLRLTSIKSVILSSHLILCRPLLLLPLIPLSIECFPMSQLFAWGGQSTGVSALASFLPKKSQGWSPAEWTGWISLQSEGLSGVFSNTGTGISGWPSHKDSVLPLQGAWVSSIPGQGIEIPDAV